MLIKCNPNKLSTAYLNASGVFLVAGLCLFGLTPDALSEAAVTQQFEAQESAGRGEIDRNLVDAYALIEAGDYVRAEALLLKTRENNPDDLWVVLNLGVVYQRTGRLQDATAAFNETLAREQASIDAGNPPNFAYWRTSLSALAQSNLKKINAAAKASAPATAQVMPASQSAVLAAPVKR